MTMILARPEDRLAASFFYGPGFIKNLDTQLAHPPDGYFFAMFFMAVNVEMSSKK